MRRNYVILASLLIIISMLLIGCFEENKPVPTAAPIIESGEETVEVPQNGPIYGNGKSIVSYKGNTYYIEFTNNDFDTEAIRNAFYGNGSFSNNQRYFNQIDSKGNIKNLFKISGANYFGIIDDRIYLKTSSDLLYSVNMKGEDSIELARGNYVDIDEEKHAVYYTSYNNPDHLYRFDTLTNKIDTFDFNNPLTANEYFLLGAYNGKIYYASFDDKTNVLGLYEHSIENNQLEKATEITSKLGSEADYKEAPNQVVYYDKEGKYASISLGDPCTGTLLGYYNGETYLLDLENKTITNTLRTSSEDGEMYYDDFFYEQAEKDFYKKNFNKELPEIDSLLTKAEINEFVKRYNIDIDAKIEGESYADGEDKYYINMEDHAVVGDNVFYKITASRRTPVYDIGWRPAYIRIVSEIYVKNLSTNQKRFVYSYVNNTYDEQVQKMLEEAKAQGFDVGESGNTEGEGTEPSITPTEEYTLKPDEMYLDINVDNIWKSEFDVKVEEVGGMIMGTRIEYEGHHKKEDGNIRIIVSKEVGARLSVYIDKDLHSQMIIE